MTTGNKDLAEITGNTNGRKAETGEIDKLIAREIKQALYREEYNKKPDVIERRRKYNTNKNKENQIVRMVLKNEITKEEGQARIAALKS